MSLPTIKVPNINNAAEPGIIKDIGTLAFNTDKNILEIVNNSLNFFPVGNGNAISQQIWVSSFNGSDTNGTGGIDSPFATYDKARTTALSLGASANKPFVIIPIGIFNVGSITISPFVNIVGLDANSSQIFCTGQLVLDSLFNTTSQPKAIVSNIFLQANGFYNILFSTYQGATLIFNNVNTGTTNRISCTGSGTTANQELIVIKGCNSFGTTGVTTYNAFNLSMIVSGCNCNALNVITNSATTNSSLLVYATYIGNIMSIQSSTSANATATIYSSNVQSGITLTGANTNLKIDSSSYESTPTFTGGALLSNVSLLSFSDGSAANTNFTPVGYTPSGSSTFLSNSVTGNLKGIDNYLSLLNAAPTGTLYINDTSVSLTAPIPHYVFFNSNQTVRTITLPDPSVSSNGIKNGICVNFVNSITTNDPGANLLINSFQGNTILTIAPGFGGSVLYTTDATLVLSSTNGWLANYASTYTSVNGQTSEVIVDNQSAYNVGTGIIQLSSTGTKAFNITRPTTNATVSSFTQNSTRLFDTVIVNSQSPTTFTVAQSASGASTSPTQDIRGNVFTPNQDIVLKSLMYFDANFTSGTRQVIMCHANTYNVVATAAVSKTDPLDGSGLYRMHTLTVNPTLFAGESYFVGALVPASEGFTINAGTVDPRISLQSFNFKTNQTVLYFPFGGTSSATTNVNYGNVSFGAAALYTAPILSYQTLSILSASTSFNNALVGVTNVNNSTNNYTITIGSNDDLLSGAEAQFLRTNIGSLSITASASVSLNGVVASTFQCPLNTFVKLKRIAQNVYITSGYLPPSLSRAKYGISSGAVTTFANSSPKALNITVATSTLVNFTATSSGVLTYTAPESRTFKIDMIFSSACSGIVINNYAFYIAINGTAQTDSFQVFGLDPVTQYSSTYVSSFYTLNQNDNVTPFVANLGVVGTTLTTQQGQVILTYCG